MTFVADQPESAACYKHHPSALSGQPSFVVPGISTHQACLKGISGIPSTYNGLKDTVLDCQRHFDGALKKARTVFTSVDAGKVLDDWMRLVVNSAREMRDFYAKPSLGKNIIQGL